MQGGKQVQQEEWHLLYPVLWRHRQEGQEDQEEDGQEEEVHEQAEVSDAAASVRPHQSVLCPAATRESGAAGPDFPVHGRGKYMDQIIGSPHP